MYKHMDRHVPLSCLYFHHQNHNLTTVIIKIFIGTFKITVFKNMLKSARDPCNSKGFILIPRDSKVFKPFCDTKLFLG